MDMFLEQLLPAFQTHGNVHLYIPNPERPEANIVFHYQEDKQGNLEVMTSIDVFDRTFWNGVTEDDEANPLFRHTINTLSYEEIPHAIAFLLTSNFSDGVLRIIEADKENKNHDKFVLQIIQYMNPMLEINLPELKRLVQEDNIMQGLFDYLKSYAFLTPTRLDNPKLEDAFPYIIEKSNTFHETLKELIECWNDVEDATSIEAYQQAHEKWDQIKKPKPVVYQKKK